MSMSCCHGKAGECCHKVRSPVGGSLLDKSRIIAVPYPRLWSRARRRKKSERGKRGKESIVPTILSSVKRTSDNAAIEEHMQPR